MNRILGQILWRWVRSVEMHVALFWPELWRLRLFFLDFGEIGHILIEDLLIFLSLFVRWTSVRFFRHVYRILRLTETSASEEVFRFRSKEMWGSLASFAILSANSFPGKEPTHTKLIVLIILLLYNIIRYEFWIIILILSSSHRRSHNSRRRRTVF